MKNLWILLTLMGYMAGAQTGTEPVFTITGKVIDPGKNAVPFANSALYQTLDSSLVTGAVSDENGRFELKAKPGNYYLKITFLSYKENRVKNIRVMNQNIDLGALTLSPMTEVLDEVVVTGEKSQMVLHLDKRVFNVGKDLSNAGGNAAEILDNVPSVTVDVEGNVSLRGSENVRILIDGRPSGLTGISSSDALRQLQGDMIENIEVITNPSSRYDAEGEVGIINIVLKKNANQGVNGSFTVQAGYPENYGGSFNLNYRKSKFNLFSSYSFNYRNNPGGGNSLNRFTQKNSEGQDSAFSYIQNSKRTRGGTSNNIRFGIDYYLNETNILTGAIMYRVSQGRNSSRYDYLNYDDNNMLVGSDFRRENEKEPEQNIEGSLTYKKEFKQEGRTLTADVKIMDTQEDERANFYETSSTEKDKQERSNNTEDERNLLFQADYIHPLGSNGKFETGVKASHRLLNNKYMVEELNDENSWEVITGLEGQPLEDHLVYTENIYAGYLMWGNKLGKFSLQTGLRAEYSDILTESKKGNTRNPKKYFNLFPSAHVSYELDENNDLQLSYSYRISRPRFRELLPFSGYSDSRSIYMGNPDLNPEYTHSFEVGNLLEWTAGSLLSSVYYRYRMGVVQRITEVDQSNDENSEVLTRVIPINLSTQNAYGLEFNLSHTFNKWWRLNSNFNFYRAITEGSYKEERLFSDTYAFTSRITSKMTILKKYDFQAGINYRAPQETPQGRNLSVYSVDLGLARDVLKGKGTITLSVQDLFNSRKWRSINDQTEGYYSESEFQWRSRSALLSFNYRLNQKKDSKSRNSIEQDGGGMEGGE